MHSALASGINISFPLPKAFPLLDHSCEVCGSVVVGLVGCVVWFGVGGESAWDFLQWEPGISYGSRAVVNPLSMVVGSDIYYGIDIYELLVILLIYLLIFANSNYVGLTNVEYASSKLVTVVILSSNFGMLPLCVCAQRGDIGEVWGVAEFMESLIWLCLASLAHHNEVWVSGVPMMCVDVMGVIMCVIGVMRSHFVSRSRTRRRTHDLSSHNDSPQRGESRDVLVDRVWTVFEGVIAHTSWGYLIWVCVGTAKAYNSILGALFYMLVVCVGSLWCQLHTHTMVDYIWLNVY